MNFIIFASVCIIAYAIFFSSPDEILPTSPVFSGVEQSAEPLQTKYNGSDFIPVTYSDLNLAIYPKANYQIYAMVMSKHKYGHGWESRISPYDLALAWDKLMLPEYQNGISYSQSGRWYYYRYKAGYPLPKSYIISHSSNHHIIPANDNLRKALDKIRKGDKVFLEGYLVYINGKYKDRNVWWNSSLTRNDSGDGACEILYLTRAVVGDELFE